MGFQVLGGGGPERRRTKKKGKDYLPLPLRQLPHRGVQVARKPILVFRVGKKNVPRTHKWKKAKFSHSKWSRKGGISTVARPSLSCSDGLRKFFIQKTGGGIGNSLGILT
jgi:hypothetical protein